MEFFDEGIVERPCQCVELLMSKRARIHEKETTTGQSSLMIASNSCHLDAVSLLLASGANVHDDKLADGQTCFTIAANKKVRCILRKWSLYTTILVFQELLVYGPLFEILQDLQEYLC